MRVLRKGIEGMADACCDVLMKKNLQLMDVHLYTNHVSLWQILRDYAIEHAPEAVGE